MTRVETPALPRGKRGKETPECQTFGRETPERQTLGETLRNETQCSSTKITTQAAAHEGAAAFNKADTDRLPHVATSRPTMAPCAAARPSALSLRRPSWAKKPFGWNRWGRAASLRLPMEDGPGPMCPERSRNTACHSCHSFPAELRIVTCIQAVQWRRQKLWQGGHRS